MTSLNLSVVLAGVLVFLGGLVAFPSAAAQDAMLVAGAILVAGGAIGRSLEVRSRAVGGAGRDGGGQ